MPTAPPYFDGLDAVLHHAASQLGVTVAVVADPTQALNSSSVITEAAATAIWRDVAYRVAVALAACGLAVELDDDSVALRNIRSQVAKLTAGYCLRSKGNTSEAAAGMAEWYVKSGEAWLKRWMSLDTSALAEARAMLSIGASELTTTGESVGAAMLSSSWMTRTGPTTHTRPPEPTGDPTPVEPPPGGSSADRRWPSW